uniref:Rut operon repressor n=1 Tax=Sym plasmid TaxID=28430 RepID=A0A515HJX4_9ZZZZ|nr:Rut operon repressor [Sym plasmid]QDL89727.1 Rut operon repressor [Sym plasmid]
MHGMVSTRQYRGNSGEDRRLERRVRLIDAARNVFAAKGFHASTVKSLCEAAGLTERYFYESFHSTEALFIAMHKQTSEHILDVLAAAIDACRGDADQKVRALLRAYFLDIQADPASARLFAVEAGFISPAAKEVCASWRQSFGLTLERVWGVSQHNSALRSAVVRSLLAMGADWMESGFSTPVEQLVDAGTSLALVLRQHQRKPI